MPSKAGDPRAGSWGGAEVQAAPGHRVQSGDPGSLALEASVALLS